MSRQLPVIACVPNYNHGKALNDLVPTLLVQNYNGIVICDDASTRELDEVHKIVRQHEGKIELVEGNRNVGAGANRNRVLESETFKRIKGPAIIHFIDADSLLNSDNTPERIRKAMDQPNIGTVGGLVLDETGVQNFYNYGPIIVGPLQLLYAVSTGHLLVFIESLRRRHPKLASRWRQRFSRFLRAWPNTFEKPVTRDVGWLIEANFAMRSDVLQEIGGFDPSIRFHSTQEFSAQLRQLGLRRHFEPGISIIRRDIDVRGPARSREAWRAGIRLQLRYIFHTRPRYNKMHEKETGTS